MGWIRRLAALAFGLGLLTAPGFSRALAEGLRAGTAKIDITPTEPVAMAGYESRKDLSRGVHDPLSARALVFEQNGSHLVLVSVENLGFYNGTAEPLRNAILEASHIKPSELFLCAIHTHSAPTLALDPARFPASNVAYTKALEGKLAKLVRTALGRLAPADLGVGSGSSPVGVNRREVVQDKSGQKRIILGRNPWVITDREVQVLKVQDQATDKSAAVLFAYATHSTSLGPHNYLISGDVHGLAAQFLERYFGQGVVTPEFAGASGDIDPWVRVLPGFRTNNGWVPEPILMGTMLGEEVARVAERIQPQPASGPIKTLYRTLELPAKSQSDTSGAADQTVPFVITVGRLGDIGFVGLGGEVFNELGKRIKTASPFRMTFILTHCNGAAGYVPTRQSYPQGGYEVQSSPFAPGSGERIAAEAVRMLREL